MHLKNFHYDLLERLESGELAGGSEYPRESHALRFLLQGGLAVRGKRPLRWSLSAAGAESLERRRENLARLAGVVHSF